MIFFPSHLIFCLYSSYLAGREARSCWPGLLPRGIQRRLHSGNPSLPDHKTPFTSCLFMKDGILLLQITPIRAQIVTDKIESRRTRQMLHFNSKCLMSICFTLLCFCRMGKLFLGDLEVSIGKVNAETETFNDQIFLSRSV